MHADGFRKLFDYHMTLNRRLWNQSITPLSDEQFTQDLPYSMGSIRNQTVHLMSTDQRWFTGLRGSPPPDHLDPADFPNRAAVRARWDRIVADMRETLANLSDERLGEAFIEEIQVWEILYHVLNHGTDHRAQLLAMLDQLGAPTFPQDYFFFAREMDGG